MADPIAPIAVLLMEAFPDRRQFERWIRNVARDQNGCWIHGAIETNREGGYEWIPAVSEEGAREVIIARLVEQHPSGRRHTRR
jgi:hypothetical protein